MFVWKYCAFGGSKDGNCYGSALGVSLRFASLFVLGCKLGSTYGEVFGFKFGDTDGIKLGLDERTEMGSLVRSYEVSKYDNIYGPINEISLGLKYITTLVSSDEYEHRFNIGTNLLTGMASCWVLWRI